MAVDFRVSRKASCRKLLESTFKSLEARGVLDATRERRPSHYHVAIFPANYTRYVANMTGTTVAKVLAAGHSNGMKIAQLQGGANHAGVLPRTTSSSTSVKSSVTTYIVKKGDSLWSIGRRHGVDAVVLRKANNLGMAPLQPGQKLIIPAGRQAN
jgi:hypothetical protein